MHDIRPYITQPFTEPGTLLYIGARVDAHSWLDELSEISNEISILEIWTENAVNLDNWVVRLGLKYKVYVGDVRYISGPLNYLPFDTFDYIWWWHGPEHLRLDEIALTLKVLESKTRKLIALACPYGLYPQGTHEGNPYETHQSTLYPDFFLSLGYQVKTDGQPDIPGSEIVAWKTLS